MIDNRADEVLAAEAARCAAIRAQDFDRLAKLLHPSLIHVHTRGNQDTRESYMKYLAEVVEILDVKRGELKVSVLRRLRGDERAADTIPHAHAEPSRSSLSKRK